MHTYIKRALWLFLIINAFLATWYLIHGDLFFNTDIARDFLLLDDLQHKKFVLIGPRASGLNGFFHGPLWMYLNFPVYLLSNGNPLASGWYWYVMLIVFLISCYVVAKKIFDSDTALLFTTLVSTVFTVPYIEYGIYNGFYNPHGALFLVPIFFYFFIRYQRTGKPLYLLLLLFINGCIVQFQIAFGGPLLIMTTMLVARRIVMKRTYMHILCYGILLIPFSTYILFDLRHNFSHLRAIVMPEKDPYRTYLSAQTMIFTRIDAIMNSGLHIFREPYNVLNTFYAHAVAFAFYFVYRKKTDKNNIDIYTYIAFFYVGYFLLSFIQNGWVQYFYWMPLFPLVYLFLARLPHLIPKTSAYILLFSALILSLLFAYQRAVQSNEFLGKAQSSWKFESEMVRDIFEDAKKHNTQFGYFIKAPDIFGYSSKYPFVYWQKKYNMVTSTAYEKRENTYIVVEPAPKGLDYINNGYTWWIKNKLHIATTGATLKMYPNGFRVDKYELKGPDLDTPIEPGVNDWIYFR